MRGGEQERERKAFELQVEAGSLASSGRYREAAAMLARSAYIFGSLGAAQRGSPRARDMALALLGQAQCLEQLGKAGDAGRLKKRAFILLCERGPRLQPFSFRNAVTNIEVQGTSISGRQMLRKMEQEIRLQTGIAQIGIDFATMDQAWRVSYAPEAGYRVLVSLFDFISDPGRIDEIVTATIKGHAAANGVRSSPPPIYGAQTSIAPSVGLDTRLYRYDALAHDGGCFVAFYRDKTRGGFHMMRHTPPLGVVHYRLKSQRDYAALRADAAAHCSAFLDLGYLDGEDMSVETLRAFMREHKLYEFRDAE